MAFMLPVVKSDYNIYPNCPSSRAGCGTPKSGSWPPSLSSSPKAGSSFVNSPRLSHTPEYSKMPKSNSQVSLSNFHTKVVDKLRKTFRSKSESTDEVCHPSGSSTVVIR